MSRLRPWLGPALVGLSVWCAAGQLTVATPDSATLRLALPAPAWVWVVATLSAWLVPAWRRDFKLALPALLATLPWWPVPLPPIGLLWTGPLAWAPIGLALGAAVGVAPLRAIGRATNVGPSAGVRAADCRRAPWLAGALTLVAGLLVAWSAAPRVPGGDEPHYLAITQSLIKSGDLRIESHYRDPDYVAAFGGLQPDFLARGRNGQIYSIHAPGLAALVLPGYAIFGYRGAQAVVLLLTAIAGSLIWRVAWRAAKDTDAAWFAWVAIVGSASFLFQSFTVFPDGPAAVVVAAGLLFVLRLDEAPQTVGTRALVVVSALVGTLPWLHTRFAILAGAVGLLVAWRLVTDPSRPAAARRARAVAFLALPFVSLVGWFTFFAVLYGTPNPTAPYGDTSVVGGTHLRYVPGGLVALLLDEQFGLLTYAPVLAASVLGLWSACRATDRSLRRAGVVTLVIVVPYLVAVASYWMWWAGRPAPPARLATAVLPALAPCLAIAWARADAAARKGLLALLGVSLAITVLIVGVDRSGLAWNDRDAQARWLQWLGPVVSLPRGWPSFFLRLTPPGTPAEINTAVATEIPFALHALVWTGIFAEGWVLLGAWLRRRARTDEVARVAVASWLAVGLMVAVQLGWWLNGAPGLDPARSQLSLLRADRGASSFVELGAFGWSWRADPVRALTIRPEEPGLVDPTPPWLRLSSVPPGSYELRFSTPRPRAGQATVTIGRQTRPLRTLAVLPIPEQSFVIALPAGAIDFTITPDPALRAAGGRVDVAPLEVRPGSPLAQSEERYGSTEVFFLDDAVFVEREGFWVGGGRMAEVVLVAGAGQGAVSLLVRNGAAANALVLDAGTFHQALSLRPSEERVILVPAPDSTGITRLRVSSRSGFRPSDVSRSNDERYLGVWLQPR